MYDTENAVSAKEGRITELEMEEKLWEKQQGGEKERI